MDRGQRTTYKSVIPFDLVGSRDVTEVMRPGTKYLYPLSYLDDPTQCLLIHFCLGWCWLLWMGCSAVCLKTQDYTV